MGMYFTWFNRNSLAAQQCNQRDTRAARPCVEQYSICPRARYRKRYTAKKQNITA